MATTTAPAEYAHRSAQAYERHLRDQAERYGTPQVDPEVAGRRAAALTAAGQAWAEDAGPFYETDGARAALGGVSKQAVSQRVRERRLLGLRLAADGSGRDRLVYPVWQFRPGVLRKLPAVLEAAGFDPRRPVTGWTIAAWLTSPDERVGGLAPVELLEAGHLDPVVAGAREMRTSLGTDERAAVQASGGRAADDGRRIGSRRPARRSGSA